MDRKFPQKYVKAVAERTISVLRKAMGKPDTLNLSVPASAELQRYCKRRTLLGLSSFYQAALV
jgi:hypothetical protein